jgi:hypothetical protein
MESADVQGSVAEAQKLDLDGATRYATQHPECKRSRFEVADSHFDSNFGYKNVGQVLEILKPGMV